MNHVNNEPRESIGSELSISESELLLLVRPALSTLDYNCPNYHRWYGYGGYSRTKPLDHDELTQFLIHQGFSIIDANESANGLSISNESAVWDELLMAGRIIWYEGGTTVTRSNGKRVLEEF